MQTEATSTFGIGTRWYDSFCNEFQKYPNIEKVLVFGSRARRSHKRFSDIDLCLFGEGLNEQDAQKIKLALEDLLHPYMVDVLSFNTITSSDLKNSILRDGLTFYEKK